ncbi:hypothetical protein [Flavobacterium granuli]|uniref:Beta-fructofuranosidase n=1 Tax=Flavobacterium granuli TaxID=280093 RepID=A0A1M5SKT7_9FLAO|nr:hypothetical protein [Flavobacterium granuli]PRZ21023.1 hypothetical protein BC624_11039 [Flavobacterium granuli]SHH39121.1 hypothetical protein SAMN05443373_11238 [Flavobacterium granuli]
MVKYSKSIVAIVNVLFCLFITNAFAQTTKNKILENGVEVPNVRASMNEFERKEMPIPYLENRQKLIPINVGRQLFVDDFLIEQTNLSRVNHAAVFSKQNPVLEPDKEWEYNKSGPYAAPFSDGIWYDEKEAMFKMWYLAGSPNKDKQSFHTCYAESKDGIKWDKKILGLFGDTNIVDDSDRDSNTIWLDKAETDPGKRYKMFNVEKRATDNRWQIVLKYSKDGIHWDKGVAQSGDLYDRTTAFYNPFSKKWVISMRYSAAIGRARSYLENSSPEQAVSLAHRVRKDAKDANISYWFGADDKEPRHPSFPNIKPEIYNHDAIAYESIMLGYYSVWQGPENKVADSLGIQKRNEVLIGYSRDGYHFSRPSHEPFMGVNEKEGAWNWGNVQSIVGVPIIKGDSLYFYASGRRLYKKMWDAYTSTGLATLRRDGFVSLDSKSKDGYITTRSVTFEGSYLFVNANVNASLKAEILDSNNKPIAGFTKEDCIAMKTNSTKYLISWKNKKDLAALKNKTVKIKFYVDDGSLYSFWVSKWKTGESNGYTAGGGPKLNPSGVDVPLD